MPLTTKLSTQLLKSILIIYFLITFSVTLVHILVEYYYTKIHIKDELKSAAKSFTPAIKTALWDLNYEQLHSIAEGMQHIPVIYSVVISDANKKILVRSEKNFQRTEELSYKYKIYQEFNGKQIYLAEVDIYSDSSVIVSRLKIGFSMLLLNALIKSGALVVLFILAFRRYLENPLGSLTSSISQINWKNRERRKIDIGFENKNELYVLQTIFNDFLDNISMQEDKRLELIQKMQVKLENEVKLRTQELKDANKQLQILANTDILTQLYNRSKIDMEIANKFEQFTLNGELFSLVMVDIDYFKSVNDEYGHQVGDSVLQEIATLLTNFTRGLDIVGRWGGEEFMIICNNTDLEGAYILAENLRKAIESYNFKGVGKKTGSFGVAQIHRGMSIDELISNVDKALYNAKNSGRNRCVKSAIVDSALLREER